MMSKLNIKCWHEVAIKLLGALIALIIIITTT